MIYSENICLKLVISIQDIIILLFFPLTDMYIVQWQKLFDWNIDVCLSAVRLFCPISHNAYIFDM